MLQNDLIVDYKLKLRYLALGPSIVNQRNKVRVGLT